jgi:predicted unusual protein kinase regulating ubiquinone biosynthesis (AarF/ABC1/UbiB family)
VQQIERVHQQLRDLLARETDLSHEAACLERMARNFEDDPDTLFPTVHHDLSAEQVLTMSFMEGVKISHADELRARGLEPEDVAAKLIQVFYKQLFVDRFFHADPHPGNFFVQAGPDGRPRLVILDFGAASEVTDALVRGMIDVLSGLLGRDDDRVVRGIETMGFVAPNGDRALLERATRSYFTKLLNLNITDFSKLSPEVAQKLADPEMQKHELRELMRSIEYPEGWFFVERAVVILFGLTSQLAPTVNPIRIGFPYVMQLLAAQPASPREAAV